MSRLLSKQLELGPVHLTVGDLDRVGGFYERALGLSPLAAQGRQRWFGVGERPLVVLHGDPNASSKPARATGLYHLALLHPNRASLGQSLQRLVEAEVPLQGGADHLVSEAIYLADPEGNGIELYRDRSRGEWQYQDGELQMATDPLDWNGVLAAANGRSSKMMDEETVMGHVHLHVADLERAEEFYGGLLGFDRVLRYGRAASFYSVGGYHHHIGLNTWMGEGAPAPAVGTKGLRFFTLLLPSAQELGELSDYLVDQGLEMKIEPGAFSLTDPSGNRLQTSLVQNNRAPGED